MRLSAIRVILVLATLLVGASFTTARAEGPAVDPIVEKLQKGDYTLKNDLLKLVTSKKDFDMVRQVLSRYGLEYSEAADLRKELPERFKQDAAIWADLYKKLAPQPERLALPPGDRPSRMGGRSLDADALGFGEMDEADLARGFDGVNKHDSGFWGEGGGDEGGFSGGSGGRINPKDQKNVNPEDKILFKDVVGIDEALEELKEIVTMLKDPARYTRVGADIPSGILMSGPPGVGKTYSARALANEAGISCFISKSGPEFINKYVGQSAENVRNVFAEARKGAPCILFIDEIEALAGKRIDVQQGADHETNGAVTELLVQMDGLTSSADGKKPLVIVVGATNRPDMLDPAILRPGRLDRKITINLPDVKGREKVLELYVAKKKKKGVQYAADVDLKFVASKTTGMSPADLKNLVNEASLLAARANVAVIKQEFLIHAIDRVVIGHERKNLVMTEDEKKQTAIHELGHALVTSLIPGGDPVGKITIIPRDNGAGGVTTSEPGDRQYWTKEQILNQIAMSMGGRVAEKLFIGTETTGPSSDLQHAHQLAKQMVVELGMSEAVGPVTFTESNGNNYLERGTHMTGVSEAMAQKIDAEIERIEREQEKRATDILTAHKATLEKLVPTLMAKETLDGDELRALLKQLEPGNKDINVAKDPGGSDHANAIKKGVVLAPTSREQLN